MYMLIVRYESDAERKRLDYAIERWENKIKVEKPKGAVILVEGNEEDVKDSSQAEADAKLGTIIKKLP